MSLVVLELFLVILRIYLRANLAMLRVSLSKVSGAVGLNKKGKNSNAVKSFVARRGLQAATGGTMTKTNQKLVLEGAGLAVKGLKHLILLLDIVIVSIAIFLAIALVYSLFIGGSFVAIAGAISSGILPLDGSVPSGGDDGSSSSDDGNKDDDKSKDKDDSGGGNADINDSTDLPKGMDKKEWDRADDMGKALANVAISSSTMKFPGSKSNDINNGHLVYQQGNTPVGYYDCSTFISGVHEAIGYKLNGSKRKGGKYDFKKDKKSDLQDYQPTSSHFSMAMSKKGSHVTYVGDKGWEKKMVPGDVMVVSGHVAMYVGKNTNGDRVVAHAGSRSSKVFYDVGLSKNGKMVGLKKLDTWMADYYGKTLVYRPSKLVK